VGNWQIHLVKLLSAQSLLTRVFTQSCATISLLCSGLYPSQKLAPPPPAVLSSPSPRSNTTSGPRLSSLLFPIYRRKSVFTAPPSVSRYFRCIHNSLRSSSPSSRQWLDRGPSRIPMSMERYQPHPRRHLYMSWCTPGFYNDLRPRLSNRLPR
jgi:hypothetical protein